MLIPLSHWSHGRGAAHKLHIAALCGGLNRIPTDSLSLGGWTTWVVLRGGYRIYERVGGGGGGGGGHYNIKRCRRQCIEARSADQSTRSAENFFAFIFHFSGWGLVAPSRFALQVPGLQVPGLP